MRLSIVVPTYNEGKNIQVLIPKILEVFQDFNIDGQIIIVDDSSSDKTGVIALELAERSKRIFVLNRPKKLGIGSAYKDGFKFALSSGSGGIMEMDADLSHNPSSIPKFIKKLKDYDLVIGSRYIPGGQTPNWTLSRRIISKVTNQLSRVFLGLKTRDCTSGFRAYNSKTLNQIDFSSVRSDGYAFQVEMVMRCEQAGLKICEIPIVFVDRSLGSSKLVGKEMWRFLTSIIQLKFK